MTVKINVRNVSFELPLSLFDRLKENCSFISNEKGEEIFFDVDPSILTSYLLFIDSDYFIRPLHLSDQDLIDGLNRCGAPLNLISHYEHQQSHFHFNRSTTKKNSIGEKCHFFFLMTSFILSSSMFSIDLYRQMLILGKIFDQEKSSMITGMIYFIDGFLFLFSFIEIIRLFHFHRFHWKQLINRGDFIVDFISSLGILFYFIFQRPLTKIFPSKGNSLWISIHLCRSIRFVQIGFRLIEIRWCFFALSQSVVSLFRTLICLFWFFLLYGSILFLMDFIEMNKQFDDVRSTILSAHETLYAIGYRNNAPRGRLTRLWTMICIYLMSSMVQLVLWWFQTRVTIEWKKLIQNEND